MPAWAHWSLKETIEFYRDSLTGAYKQIIDGKMAGQAGYDAIMAHIAEQDLFFLLTDVLNRKDLEHPWLFWRCREIQENPDGYIDLSAREHYKSTLISFGHTIFDIIKDPETTFGIFSHTRPIAKQFLRQIMFEMETNPKLPKLWPRIFWQNPRTQAPKWSEDEGIIVKRKSNPKECTVEAYGLVDGMPTSKHFKHRVYDDVVTKESVSTPEQIAKTTTAWELSNNLAAGKIPPRYAGTRYHLFDTYAEIIKRGSAIPRIRPATKNGREDGEPVYMSRELLAEKRRDQGIYTFASQMLLNPVADKAMGFKTEWLQYATVSQSNAMARLNRYLLCDPASEKRKKARKDPDYTSMWVIGLGPPNNFYLLDGIRDRLNLGQRANEFIRLHRKWRPMKAGYEQYGMQADIEHIKYVQREQLYEFDITELGGQMAKNDKIKRLIPVFEGGRFFLPNGIIYTDTTGRATDLIKVFIEEEYLAFPVLAHDDMFENMSRILDEDMAVTWPDPDVPVEAQEFDYHSIEDAQLQPDWTLA